MQSVLVAYLHAGRHFDPSAGRWEVNTPVARLLCQVEEEATAQGLTLSRWQSSKAKWIVKITYAIHFGSRTCHFRHLYHPVYYVTLNGREGKTEKCEAYRKLSVLLSYLHSMGEPSYENPLHA